MKTISRLLFAATLFISTSLFAQISPGDEQYNSPTVMADLQNHLQYLQSIETALLNEIISLQLDLTGQQDIVASIDIQITDETNAGNDISALQAERAQVLDLIAFLQVQLAEKQSQLALVQSEIATTSSTIQMLLHDKGWVSTYGPQSTPPQLLQNTVTIQHPTNPNWQSLMFKPTGSAQQDELIVQEWLRQHGFVDAF
jgi:hypothetical protein